MTTVTRALSSDFPEVSALLSRTPMSAKLPLAVERLADEERAFPHLGESSLGFVARMGGAVVGYVHASLGPRTVAGGTERLLYFGDLRVDFESRRTGIASALLDAMADHARARGVVRGYCLVNDGNRPMLRLLAEGSARIKGVVGRSFSTITRPLLGWHNEKRPNPYVPFVPQRAAFESLARSISERLLGPVVDAAELESIVHRYPEIIFYTEASAPGRVAFALWDQAAFRRLRVLSLPPRTRAMHRIWKCFSGSEGIAPPDLGEPWQSVEVCFVPSPIPSARVRHVVSHASVLRCHFVNILEDLISGPSFVFPSIRTKTHVVPFGVDRATSPACSPDTFVDLGLL